MRTAAEATASGSSAVSAATGAGCTASALAGAGTGTGTEATGGIAGNLTDRLLPSRHEVIDFIYFFMQQRGGGEIGFPAFNIADTAICTGVGLIFLITWRNEHTPKQPVN